MGVENRQNAMVRKRIEDNMGKIARELGVNKDEWQSHETIK